MWVRVVYRPAVVDSGIDIGDSFYITTDANGEVRFELVRGSTVNMYVSWMEKEIEFKVPDAASANLAGLMTPYVVSAELSPGPVVSMQVGEKKGFAVKATQSDGIVTGVTYKGTTAAQQLTYICDDSSKASISDTGTLEALSAGTVSLTATIRNSKWQLLTTPTVTVIIS
jgi:hypothetical protein